MKAFVIANPQSGKPLTSKAKFCQEIQKALPGAQISFTEPEGEKSPENLASLAQKEGFRHIIVRGGDGTISRVVNGLDFTHKHNPSLGLIPAGTGNDFAISLGIPPSFQKSIEIIRGRKTRLVDLGVARFSNDTRFFINTVSVGIDAEINNQAHILAPHLRKIGLFRFAYVIAALKRMLYGLNFPEVIIEIDGKIKKRAPISLVAITNSFRYGGGFKINPLAQLDDGWLDLCMAAPVKRLAIPWYMILMKLGRHCNKSIFSFYQLKHLIIESGSLLPIQLDGEEYPPQVHLEVSVLPNFLKVIVPE